LPKAFPPGSYALGVLAWYRLGRFFPGTAVQTPGSRCRAATHQSMRRRYACPGRRRRFAGEGIRVV